MRYSVRSRSAGAAVFFFAAIATSASATVAANANADGNPLHNSIRTIAVLQAVSANSTNVASQQSGLRGEPAAVAAAEKILEIAGGRDVWSGNVLATEQNLYLRSGESGTLHIWRDLESGIRRFERKTQTEHLIEILTPQGGWRSVNGVVTPMSAHELAANLQGLKQEPYTLYHRIAKRDPALRFELREDGRTLMAFDRDERVLSWFSLDNKQGVIGWGSHFNGNVNQHFYGPIEAVGNTRLPKFGVASTGAFRFEYTKGNVTNNRVELPDFAKK